MACSITIDSVAAVDPLSNPPTALHIEGSATGCNEVEVSVVCNVGGVPDAAVVTADAGGHWALDLPIPINSLCSCGAAVTVHAECVTDPNCSAAALMTIECPQGCPIVSNVTATPADVCNLDGTRTVTFSATVTDTSGVVTVVEWEYNSQDSSASVAVNALSTQTVPGSHDYLPGAYTATLSTVYPEGCPDVSVDVTVDECPPVCPGLGDVTVTAADCDANGNRLVTLSFAQPLTADVDFGDGTPTTGFIGTSGVVHAYAPTGPYTATISVEDCPPLQVQVGPLDICVPGIPIGACCMSNGQCIDMSQAQCVVIGGTYQGDGTTCASTDCSSSGTPGGGGGSSSSPLCPFFGPLISLLLGLAIALGLLAVNFNCLGVPIPPFLWGIIAGIAAAAAIALGVWYLLCKFGTCPCPSTCDLLAIVWSSFLGGAIVAAYLFGCCPLMGVFVIALGGVAMIAFLTWFLQCFDFCTMIAYLVSTVISGVGTVIAIVTAIPILQACALGPVGVAAGILAAIVGIAAAACIAASKGP